MRARIRPGPPAIVRKLLLGALGGLVAACGGGGGGGGDGNQQPTVQQVAIKGHVIDGFVEGALVCLDFNVNGRCDSGDPQASTDADGAYELTIPAGSTAPLLAEVIAGRSRDHGPPNVVVDASYRMASPSYAYDTEITPFSTLVMLTGQANYALAEDLVRDAVGLPPRYDIHLDAPAATGSLQQTVEQAIVSALKARGLALDFTAPGAFASVVAAFPAALTDLPQLRITTKDAAPIESREVYVDATYALSNPAAAVPDVSLAGKIRGRGHSTWGNPKNPYKVQFANDSGYAAIGDVLGMKKQRNWALLADWFDRSLMRNKLALSLANSTLFTDGLKWNPSGQHVEVWLNGDYVGVYLLTEDIRIDPARLDIRKMSSKAADGQVDGGYIVEVDERLDCYNDGTLNLQLVTPRGVPICIDTPDEEAITPAQLAYVKNLLVQVETDLYASNRLDRVNPVSFADWYLLQELFRNNDAVFVSSDFMWKDTDSATDPGARLLNMGPIWDFDISAGNINYNGNWQSQGCWLGKRNPTHWFSAMLDNGEFRALVIARWKQKRPALEAYLDASIDTYARRLAAGQQRNFQRWQTLGTQLVNYYTFATHAEEVAFLKRFLHERIAWLDEAYASPATFETLCR